MSSWIEIAPDVWQHQEFKIYWCGKMSVNGTPCGRGTYESSYEEEVTQDTSEKSDDCNAKTEPKPIASSCVIF